MKKINKLEMTKSFAIKQKLSRWNYISSAGFENMFHYINV